MTHRERERLDPLLARATRALRDEPPASIADVSQVMARVRVRPRPMPNAAATPASSRRGVQRRWWVASGVAAAAVAVFVGSAVRESGRLPVREPNDGIAPGEIVGAPVTGTDMRNVRFTLEAPGASRVAVAGDFNHWRPVQLRREGDTDQWVVTLPIASGTYSYSFMVEGRRWVADPIAPAAPDDGFGAPSSVLIVEAQRKGST